MLNLNSHKSSNIVGARLFRKPLFHVPFLFVCGVGALCQLLLLQPQATFGESGSSSAVTSSILEVPSPDEEVKLTFTLYNGEGIQYFSAGVGIEERKASYPPYPLKLIFVQGARAFLAEVTVSIVKSDGTTLVDIPSEHVLGPWLFINLAGGNYTITATDSQQRAVTQQVQVGGTKTKVVHFRWPS